jgi:hypothetical protein
MPTEEVIRRWSLLYKGPIIIQRWENSEKIGWKIGTLPIFSHCPAFRPVLRKQSDSHFIYSSASTGETILTYQV